MLLNSGWAEIVSVGREWLEIMTAVTRRSSRVARARAPVKLSVATSGFLTVPIERNSESTLGSLGRLQDN